VGPLTVRTFWEGVVKVTGTEMHLFVYLSPGEAIVVPGRAFESERAFEDFCETARRDSKAAGRPGEGCR
jgi:hypothetical protein